MITNPLPGIRTKSPTPTFPLTRFRRRAIPRPSRHGQPEVMPTLHPPDYPDCPEAPLLGFGRAFAEEIARSVISAVRRDNWEKPHEMHCQIAGSLTMLEGFRPADHQQCMMAAAGVALWAATMDSLSMAISPGISIDHMIRFRNSSAVTLRGYCKMVADVNALQGTPMPGPSRSSGRRKADPGPDVPPAPPKPGTGENPAGRTWRGQEADRAPPGPRAGADDHASRETTPAAPDQERRGGDTSAAPTGLAPVSEQFELPFGPPELPSGARATAGDGPVAEQIALPVELDATAADAEPVATAEPAECYIPPGLSDAQIAALADDFVTRPDGTPASLVFYEPKPWPPIIPKDAPINMALATRPKLWRQVNEPKPPPPHGVMPDPPPPFCSVMPPPSPEDPPPRATVEPPPLVQPPPEPLDPPRGPLDLREKIYTGDALARFASARLDPNAPVPPPDYSDEELIVELELLSTGGTPEGEAHRAELIAANPEGRPIKVIRYGTRAPERISDEEKPPDTS